MQITYTKTNELAPLYRQYPVQSEPQPAYVELDPEAGTLDAAWNPVIGTAVPMDVWHHRRIRSSVRNDISEAALLELLEAIRPLAERIEAGYDRHWDGHNHVGRYDEDAEAAIDEIRELCEAIDDDDCDLVWDAGEWLSSCSPADLGVTADTTDEQLAAIAADLEDDAEINFGRRVRLENTEIALRDKRDEARDEAEDA